MITHDEDAECTTYVIHLDGQAGNSLYLLGMAQKFMRDQYQDKDTTDNLLLEMQGGDYHHLIKTFDNAFGNDVTLVTTDEDILALNHL